ncbi:hypothetical protein ABZT06_39825 [Streptomyces sp. NPDC005483]|uniref:hypothetical protein n=1 Tax=Streptomyces sp. NPDC005483 TaxID=3154882 RepID=UPI0033A94CB5
MSTLPTPAPVPAESDGRVLAPVVPLRAAGARPAGAKAEGQDACLRIRPWRTTGRLDCLSDLDCDPDRLCVDSECI